MLNPDNIETIEQYLAEESASKSKLANKLLSEDINLIKNIKESVCSIERDKFKSNLRAINNNIKQEKKKRKIHVLYYSIAASLLLIIGISAMYIANNNSEIKLANLTNKQPPVEITSTNNTDTTKLKTDTVIEINNNLTGKDTNTSDVNYIASKHNNKNKLPESFIDNINYASKDENSELDISVTKNAGIDSLAVSISTKRKGKFIKINNIFSPNNDSINDKFKPEGNELKLYRISVFDNSGKLVWKSSKLENGKPAESWDGKCDSTLLPAGNYKWKVEALFYDGTVWKGVKNKNGNYENSGILTIK